MSVVVGGGGGAGSSSFFFSVSDVFVVLVDVVLEVSVGAAVVVIVVSVCSGGDVGRLSFGIGGVALPTVSVTTGAVRGAVRGREGEALGYAGVVLEGNDPAIVAPVVSVPSGFGFVGSVKFVVVSMFVSVSTGAGVSPGALMVEVTPLADPSCTTSYCC